LVALASLSALASSFDVVSRSFFCWTFCTDMYTPIAPAMTAMMLSKWPRTTLTLKPSSHNRWGTQSPF
jgi:hypothetical protein